MKLRALWTAFAVVLLAALATGQAQQQYLDVYIAQVKPEKRADFDALSKKMVAGNRQNKGNSWIAMETVYGRETGSPSSARATATLSRIKARRCSTKPYKKLTAKQRRTR